MKEITDPELNKQITDAYFEYFTAYSQRNWDQMVNLFDSNMTMFGTGVDEVALSGEATLALFRREFQQAPSRMSYQIKALNVFAVCVDIALITIVMDMDFFLGEGCIHSLDNRTSALMLKKDGVWKIAHAHWSQPDIYQDPGQSVPFKMLLEENRRLEAQIASRTEELRKKNAELTDALAKVKTLKGILPICSHCKNIRNDEGYWTQLEQYISEYTDAFFSHSICPDCIKTLYPDLLESTCGCRGDKKPQDK